MTQLLYARPYDISAEGFLFDSAENFTEQASKLKNAIGQPIEEFEISLFDGDEIDRALADAWRLDQANFTAFICAAEQFNDHNKIRFIIVVGECGYSFDPAKDHLDDLDIDIHEVDSLKDLVEQFIDDGLFGSIPENLAGYIDVDAIARDLSFDYTETTVAGKRLLYDCR